MTQTKRYRSPALQSLHEVMEDLHEVGAIDKATMRDFDLGCLTPVEKLAPEAIRQIREKAHMSQATFALALNVPKMLISKWERGEVHPSGPSLKLLALADAKGIDTILCRPLRTSRASGRRPSERANGYGRRSRRWL